MLVCYQLNLCLSILLKNYHSIPDLPVLAVKGTVSLEKTRQELRHVIVLTVRNN